MRQIFDVVVIFMVVIITTLWGSERMVTWTAKWIWIGGERDMGHEAKGQGEGWSDEALARNFYLRARKTFFVPEGLKSATLHITADARYFLFINGQRVGNGPIRGWQFSWFYDTYDLTPYLRLGEENVLSVLVWQPGEANFQYPLGRGGLLAQLEMTTQRGRKIRVVTDQSWMVSPHPGYDRRTPRISCQQGFVEHYDAQKEEGQGASWTELEYDDSDWERARELGPVGTKPWEKLVPRNIPFLTMEPVYPVRLVGFRTVSPPAFVHSLDLRPNLIPNDRLSNRRGFIGIALTVVSVPKPMEVKVTAINGVWLGAKRVRVNGQDVKVSGNTVILPLKRGENLIAFDVSGTYHDWWFTTVWETTRRDLSYPKRLKENLTFINPLKPKARSIWVTAGPFSSRDGEGFQSVWNARSVADLQELVSRLGTKLKPVPLSHTASDHVFARIVMAKGLDEPPQIENGEAICVPNGEAAVIHPPRGGDVELLLDFGREVVGFLEFSLDAPRGVTLDFYGFEAIHPRDDGGFDIQHTWGLNNVLRYITRKGWQRYTSIVRRGFRYLIVTVRFPEGETRPVRLRFIRCLLNTYPYTERGDFLCDDWALNEIWRMCRYTLRLCSEDTYVDCPAYEQTFWVGDARNEALIAYATYGGYPLARRSWLLAGQSLHRSPLVESQVPSGWQDILTAWALFWVWACEEHYRYTRDEAFLREIYPSVAQQMRGIAKRFLRQDGLFEIEAWNMLDWAPMDTPRKGVVTHQNALLVEAYRRAAKMARWLGRKKDAEEFEALAERVKGAINEHLWDETKQAYIDALYPDGSRSTTFSVQTQTMVYLCDAATPKRAKIIRRYLYDPPEDFVWFGSPFTLFFLMEAYARDGEIQRIVDLIRREWGRMIDYGATTTWETLSPRTRSHCHAWSAAPAFFLSSYILGVRPTEEIRDRGGRGKRGHFSVVVTPEPCDLRWARGRFPTPLGEVEVFWDRGEKRFTLWIILPDGVNGEAMLPSFVPVGAKVDVWVIRGKATLKWRDGRWRCDLAAGTRVRLSASWKG